MRRYRAAVGSVMLVMLASFGVVEALDFEALRDPAWLGTWSRPAMAAMATALLIADVVLPVPSSLIMIANGAVFGMWLGASISFAGAMGSAALGFWLGRTCTRGLHLWIGQEEMARADRLFERWGPAAILLSRPVPILAETVALFAGGSCMRWRMFVALSACGYVPLCLLYAVAGSLMPSVASAMYVFGASFAVTAVAWFVLRWRDRRKLSTVVP